MIPERLAVVMCVDRAFVLPLAVALASVDAAVRPDTVTVYVLHPGIAPETRRRVTDPLSAVRVEWISVEESLVSRAHFSVFLSAASLYRLLLGDLLPDDVERVLYLDADVVLAGSPLPLIRTDLDGKTIAAVRESQSPWAAGPLGPSWRELGLQPGSPYFNSGMMLVDVARWRQREIGRRTLEILRTSAPRWGDQDALNAVLEGDWQELPRRWNLQSAELRGESASWALWRDDVEAAIADPAVIHFTERDKPWDPGTAHPLAPVWYSHLDRTDWRGWRPTPLRQPGWERWARAAVRAARTYSTGRRASALPE